MPCSPFLTQRGHSISPSLFSTLTPDNSQSLSPSRRISLLQSPSPPAPCILLLCPEPVPLLQEERSPALTPPTEDSLHTSCSLWNQQRPFVLRQVENFCYLHGNQKRGEREEETAGSFLSKLPIALEHPLPAVLEEQRCFDKTPNSKTAQKTVSCQPVPVPSSLLLPEGQTHCLWRDHFPAQHHWGARCSQGHNALAVARNLGASFQCNSAGIKALCKQCSYVLLWIRAKLTNAPRHLEYVSPCEERWEQALEEGIWEGHPFFFNSITCGLFPSLFYISCN